MHGHEVMSTGSTGQSPEVVEHSLSMSFVSYPSVGTEPVFHPGGFPTVYEFMKPDPEMVTLSPPDVKPAMGTTLVSVGSVS